MKRQMSLPRPKGNALLVALELGKDMLGAPIRYFDELGDTFATSIFGQEYILTRDPAFIHEILVKQNASFIKDKVTRGVSVIVGNGLLTNDDESWRPRRRAMQPPFQPATLETLIAPMLEETEIAISGWNNGAVVDVSAAMIQVAVRCALRAVFGINPDSAGDVAKYTQTGMDYFYGIGGTLVPLPLWIPSRLNREFIVARRALRSTLARIVEKARAAGQAETPLSGLFVAECAGLLSEKEMLDEAMTLLIAGHDPSALTLTYTLAALAAHPLEQAKIHRELDADEAPSAVATYALPSGLKRALMESMRLYPASWAVGREPRCQVKVEGHVLTPGTQITVHQWAAHRHPQWFSEPDLFQPDRWRGDFAASLPKGLYVPWGSGPRVCIGNHFSALQMMVSLRHILSKFRLEAVEPFPGALRASITVAPRVPIQARVIAR